jgi:hypothetical protein
MQVKAMAQASVAEGRRRKKGNTTTYHILIIHEVLSSELVGPNPN